jgi:DNA-binding beta-propeller fold protein YncE
VRCAAFAVVALVALGAFAQDESPEQITVTPQLLFNQHLYYGTFARPRAVAYDRKHNEIWIADSGNGLVGIFRPDGAELYSFSSKEYLRDPVRLAISPTGDVAVIEGDRKHVRLFDYRGGYEGDVALTGIGDKPVLGAIAWDANGRFYVADNRSSQIFVYGRDGKLKFQFGSRGTDDGQFQSVCGVAIADDGTVFVADQQAIAIQVFDDQGNFLRGWGKHEMGAQNVSLPSGIALDGKGHVLVTDELRHQVKIFSLDGKFIDQFGGLGDGLGQLSFPTDIAADGAGHVVVTERSTSRAQVFELRTSARD